MEMMIQLVLLCTACDVATGFCLGFSCSPGTVARLRAMTPHPPNPAPSLLNHNLRNALCARQVARRAAEGAGEEAYYTVSAIREKTIVTNEQGGTVCALFLQLALSLLSSASICTSFPLETAVCT